MRCWIQRVRRPACSNSASSVSLIQPLPYGRDAIQRPGISKAAATSRSCASVPGPGGASVGASLLVLRDREVDSVDSSASLPVHRVPRAGGKIRVDGDLDKGVWRRIEPLALFPSDGRDAPVPATELRIAHDGERLCVAFRCAAASIVATYTGRNEPIYEEDVVEAFLAPGGDPHRYFELEANPIGAWFEARVENPDGRATMRVDRDWICRDWERSVRIRTGGWDVEWAIPFASLGATPPTTGGLWRANFYRIDRANGGAFSAWSPTGADPPDFHVPARFGSLVFD